MDYANKVLEYEEAYLNDLKELVRIASLRDVEHAEEHAPFGPACRAVLDKMLGIGKRDGFTVKDIDGYAGVIEYGDGEESVGVLGHLDVVPLGEGWTMDPLGCTMHDGYIFGRGVLDDKGPILAGYYALKILKDRGFKPHRKIMIIMGCDEESGMGCMNYYVKHGEIPTLGFTPDADFPLIYGEKGILDFHIHGQGETVIKSMHAGERLNIVIGKASALVESMSETQEELFAFYLKSHQLNGKVCRLDDGVELTIEGKAFHSAMCYNGDNAALHLLNFIGSAYEDAMSQQLYALCKDWKGSGINNYIYGAYMNFLTMNTGIVEVEDGVFDASIDIRYPNDITGQEILERAQAHIAKKGFAYEILPISDSKPLFVDPKSELITTLEKSYRKYSHDDFTPAQTIGGGTYARMFDHFVAFGPEFPQKEETEFYVGGAHDKDEGIKISHLLTAMAIYADAIEQLAR